MAGRPPLAGALWSAATGSGDEGRVTPVLLRKMSSASVHGAAWERSQGEGKQDLHIKRRPVSWWLPPGKMSECGVKEKSGFSTEPTSGSWHPNSCCLREARRSRVSSSPPPGLTSGQGDPICLKGSVYQPKVRTSRRLAWRGGRGSTPQLGEKAAGEAEKVARVAGASGERGLTVRPHGPTTPP